MKLLENKRVVITGGTRGIGRAIVERFAEEGASIAFLGTNSERGEALSNVLKERAVEGQEFLFRPVDVSNTAEIHKFAEEIHALWGDIDVLINCAGITRDKLLIRMEEEDWDRVIDTNLKSVYNTTHAFLRNMMKKRSGKVINITSVIGFMGNPGQANYGASKAGVIGFSSSLAKEVASRNIQINCIAPGFIGTDMTDKLTEEQRKGILEKVPMGRLGEVQEIAAAALFLAGKDSNYITGQVLTVDGGLTV
ncbi:MAG: 3-oxoacyl-[acyl-carrier-protein] reductase [Verrucomicrobia bacterium]|nr:3-oxoacyl-[acyl-carrier-protein] reductase [Verrucomicrobiota bacterium]